jgi:5'-deoxynucleotidase YfbR-like HD superfamily hydrolase
MDVAAQLTRFARVSERLKLELRHSWMSNGRRESVAEHSWHMALLAMLVSRILARGKKLSTTWSTPRWIVPAPTIVSSSPCARP